MPTNACQFFYDCKGCRSVLRPKAGIAACFARSAQFPVRRFRRRARQVPPLVVRRALPGRSARTCVDCGGPRFLKAVGDRRREP
nr:hypothetical protein [Hankyongella ginsenosidimutans]